MNSQNSQANDLNSASKVSMDAWMDTKENVQPLREGRDASTLTSAATPGVSQSARMAMMEERRLRYEERLAAERLKGDDGDVLEVWKHYIHWAIQSNPKDSSSKGVVDLLWRCIQEFLNSPKAAKRKVCSRRNDANFIRLFHERLKRIHSAAHL